MSEGGGFVFQCVSVCFSVFQCEGFVFQCVSVCVVKVVMFQMCAECAEAEPEE